MKRISEKVYSNAGNKDVLAQITGSGKVILDIGCGGGDNARIMHRSGHIVDGITGSELESEEAKPFLRSVYICNLENGLPELNVKYDYVVCSHVIEHIAYPEKMLADIKNILAVNGKMIVALPNLMNYRSRLELLKGNFPSHESGTWDFTHLRWYTFDSGKDLLVKHGFKIEKAWVAGEMPLLTVFRFIPAKIRDVIFSFLAKISRGFFATQLLYVVQKG